MKNLPSKISNESIFTKIKRFFINLFKTNDSNKKELEKEEIIEPKNQQKAKDSFKEEIQSDIKKQEKRERILSYIDNDEKSIYNLSNERLKELIKIYDEEISKVDMQIKLLKYN